jgi:hypothetical protein
MKRAIIFSLSLFSFFAVKAQLRPGDISPTAKVIDADKIGYFNKGAAIIQKGELTALIDSSGNFIIPYGVYLLEYIRDTDAKRARDFQSGIFKAKKKTSEYSTEDFFINSNGKVLIDKKIIETNFKTADKYSKYDFRISDDPNYIELISSSNRVPTFYIDWTGKRYQVSEPLRNFSEGRGFVNVSGGMIKYITLDNKPLNSETYDNGQPFINGLACVTKKDAYGNIKHGFINLKGELVIPFQFSTLPDNFYGNATKVIPQNQEQFHHAFINKSGEVIYKHTAEYREKLGGAYFDAFYSNLCISQPYGKHLFTTKGYLTTIEENIKGMKLDAIKNKNIVEITGFSYLSWIKNHVNNILVYDKQENIQSIRTHTSSYIDLNNGKVIDAPFARIESSDVSANHLVFDPVSQLAYAKMYKGYSASRRAEYIEGYINREGVFVIVVKKEASVW